MGESVVGRVEKFVVIAIAAVLATVALYGTAYADEGGEVSRQLQAASAAANLQPQANSAYALIASDGYLYPCNVSGKKTATYWNDDDWAASKAIDNLKQVFIASDVKSVTDRSFKYKTQSTNYDGSVYRSSSTVYGLLGNDSSKITTVTFLLNDKGANACTSIGANAFSGNASLTAIKNLNKTKVTSVGKNAFAMTGLKSVALPKTLKSLGVGAFQSCTKLTSVSNLNTTKITSVAQSAFFGCKKLASVSLPATCTTVGKYAFRECAALKKAVLGSKTTSIGEVAFNGCTSLTSISLGSKLKKIDDNAFVSCKKLASVSLPATCTKLGEGVFSGCSGLKKVTMKSKTLVTSTKGAKSSLWTLFGGTPIAKSKSAGFIYVPKALLSKYRNKSYSSPWYEYRAKFRSL